jgi:hypothetical protein
LKDATELGNSGIKLPDVELRLYVPAVEDDGSKSTTYYFSFSVVNATF